MENKNNNDLKHELEGLLDEFLSSERLRKKIEKFQNENPPEFAIKGKGSWRAHEETKRIESQRNRLDNLWYEFLQAAEHAKKNRKLSLDDKLQKLIPALIEIQKILFPDYLEYHKFVDEGFIDLKKELDLENLTSDHDNYSIVKDTELKEFGYLNTHQRNIWLSNKYEFYFLYCKKFKPVSWPEFQKIYEEMPAQETQPIKTPSQRDSLIIRKHGLNYSLDRESISEIWPRWLPTLNQESIKSTDRLTQVLLCYTIKRALNGDEEAIKKLCDLYDHVAQGIAVRIGKKFHIPRETFKDMKQDAKILLRLIIAGFKPDYILNQLTKDESDRTMVALPKWVKRFYVYYLSEYIPKRMKEMMEEAEGNSRAFEKFMRFAEVVTLLNLYAPIQDGTVWKHTPKRINRFNSYSYRPFKMGPKRNLTTWLFGTRGKCQYGKIYQLIRDNYKSVIRELRGTKTFDFRDEFEDDRERNLTIKEKREALRAKDNPMNKSPEEIIDKLRNLGIPKRNAEIFAEWKFEGTTQRVLAEKYRFSEQWIRKICRSVEKSINNQ